MRAADAKIKYIGRTIADDNGTIWCALSGSGVEFTYRGASLDVVLAGDDVTKLETQQYEKIKTQQDVDYARIAVYVNNERIIDERLEVPQKTYCVWRSDKPQEITVRIVKLSEAPHSIVGIQEFVMADTDVISPTPDKPLKLEFIGDSITCGYGVDDNDPEHHFSTATEDETASYAYLTAQSLDADYSMVSYSGYGIISGYTETDEKRLTELVPDKYEDTGYSRGKVDGVAVTLQKWDFDRFCPDFVVINLGTNDDSYCKDIAQRQEEYAACYAQFIQQVHSHNPGAYILCVYGIMTDRLYPYVQKAVELYRQKTGDERITALHIEPHTDEAGYGADWHPSKLTHIRAAKEVTAKINSLNKKC